MESYKSKFLNNPSINPETGRKIIKGGKTYNHLMEKYGLNDNVNLKNNSNEIVYEKRNAGLLPLPMHMFSHNSQMKTSKSLPQKKCSIHNRMERETYARKIEPVYNEDYNISEECEIYSPPPSSYLSERVGYNSNSSNDFYRHQRNILPSIDHGYKFNNFYPISDSHFSPRRKKYNTAPQTHDRGHLSSMSVHMPIYENYNNYNNTRPVSPKFNKKHNTINWK